MNHTSQLLKTWLLVTVLTIIVHQKNEEIPSLVAEGQADVMITEITEAPYYVQTDPRLAAPLRLFPHFFQQQTEMP